MMLKLGNFRKQMRNTSDVLNRGVGEGRKILIGPIM
jgi:hypothetical protein